MCTIYFRYYQLFFTYTYQKYTAVSLCSNISQHTGRIFMSKNAFFLCMYLVHKVEKLELNLIIVQEFRWLEKLIYFNCFNRFLTHEKRPQINFSHQNFSIEDRKQLHFFILGNKIFHNCYAMMIDCVQFTTLLIFSLYPL